MSLDTQTEGLQMCCTGRGWTVVCFKCFCKNSSRLLSTSSLVSSSFLICFEWFKTWWVSQLRLYKTSSYFRSKDVTTKDFKLGILICFNLPTFEHWAPLHHVKIVIHAVKLELIFCRIFGLQVFRLMFNYAHTNPLVDFHPPLAVILAFI